MMPERINPHFLACILQSFPGIVFPLPQNRQPELAFRETQWRHQTRQASFFRRSSGTPIFQAVVFMRTPWFFRDNGSPGGAAFGLAGIH